MPRVVYDFVAQGNDAVEEAFKRIREERKRSPARESERTLKPLRDESQKTKAEEREAAKRLKIAEKEAKDRQRIADKAAKEEERARRKVAQDKERDEKRATREKEREERKKQRAAERTAEIEARQTRRKAVARLTGAYTAAGAFVGGQASGAVSTVKSALMSTAETALKEQIDFNEAARRVSINSRGAGEAFRDPKKLKDEFTRIGAESNAKPIDVASGVQAFITKTGDAGKAMEFAPIVATAAKAADANLESVSKTAADLFQKFGIQTADEMQKALAAIYFGGKSGAFELADFAEKMAPIASAGQRFGVDKGVEGVKTMQGLAQIAMSATGDRDRAATAVEAMMRQLVTKSTDLQAMGVKVFDKKTNKTRNVTDILTETVSSVGGLDAQKKAAGLQKIFGDEGIRGLSPLIDTFMTAARETKGTNAEKKKAGQEAVREQLGSAINAKGGWAEVQKDAAFANDSSASKLNQSWDQMKAKIGEGLLPAFDKLAEKLPQFAEDAQDVGEAMGDLAEVMVDMLDTLKSLGVFDFKSDKRSARMAERAGAEVNRLENIKKERALTQEEQAKLDTAKTDKASLSSQADFIKQFVDARSTFSNGLFRGDDAVAAKKYWDMIQQNPESATTYAKEHSFYIPGTVSGQNDAQTELIEKAAQQRKQQQDSTMTGANPVTAALAELERALTAASKAANGMAASAAPSVFAGG